MNEVTVNVGYLTILVSVILPAIVALVKNRFAGKAVGAWLLLFLAAVTGTVTEIINASGTFDVKVALTNTLTVFVVAIASHYGFLKPVGVTGSDGAIQTAIPGGIGRSDLDKAA